MCVGFWSLENSEYALILCTNRDELLSRPTTNAHFHSFGHKPESEVQEGFVLSGRDLRAGGTWLGINRSGRVALLTNITEPPPSEVSSRGYLVSSYLLSDPAGSLSDELDKLNAHDAKFAGFNLLLLSPSSCDAQNLSFDAALVTNHGAGGVITSRPLSADERRCGSISNGVDGKGGNEWPKVHQGIQSLHELLGTVSADTNEAELTNSLFELLTWQSAEPPRERSQLRDTIFVDPLPIPVGCGPSDLYGTRLSTILLVRRDGKVLFVERDIWQMDEEGKVAMAGTESSSDRQYRFQLPISSASS